jgi:hypothetical protein
MKTVIFIVLVTLFANICFAQTGKKQTTFGSEMDIEEPVKIPLSFLSQLSHEDRRNLQKCSSKGDSSLSVKANPLDNFVGSELDVRNPRGGSQLLIVKSNSACFDGAHNSRFWILAKKRGQSFAKYRRVFETQANGLSVSNKASVVYPNLEVFSHTAVEGFTSTVKYVRGKYRTTSCYVEPLGEENPRKRRMKCSKYHWEFRK